MLLKSTYFAALENQKCVMICPNIFERLLHHKSREDMDWLNKKRLRTVVLYTFKIRERAQMMSAFWELGHSPCHLG